MATNPLQIDPVTLALIKAAQGNSSAMPQAPPDTTASAMGPTAPVTGPTTPIDPQAIAAQAMQKGTQLTEEQLGRSRERGDLAMKLQEKLGSIPIPPTAPHSKVLSALLSLTGPGRAIQAGIYGPGMERYTAETGALSKQISDLLTGQQREEEPISATARMGPSYMSASARETSALASKQKADQEAIRITNQNSQALVRLQQGAQKLSLDQQNLALRKWFDTGLLQAMNTRIAAGQEENSARIDANEDMKAALSQNQWALQHPIWNALGLAPTMQGAPGAATAPVKPTTDQQNRANRVKSSKPSGGGGAKHGVFNPATGQVEWK